MEQTVNLKNLKNLFENKLINYYILKEINFEQDIDENLCKETRKYFQCNNESLEFTDNDECESQETYVYLNAVEVFENRIEVMMLYTGTAVLEYFEHDKCKWNSLKQSTSINVKANKRKIKFRIKISKRDCITRLLLLVPKNEFLKNHRVIKQIDFISDIDINSSGRFNIDSVTNSLEFIFQPILNLNKEDFLEVLGVLNEDNNNFFMIPQEHQIYGLSRLDSQVISKEKISSLNINFIHASLYFPQGHYRFRMMIGNEFYNSVMRKTKEEGLQYYKMTTDVKRRLASIDYKRRYLSFSSYKGEMQQVYEQKYKCRNKIIDINVNIKEGYVSIDKEKKILKDKAFLWDEECYISLICNYESLVQEEFEKPLIREIICGSDQGFLHLKPFKNYNNKLKVVLLFSGSVKVEQFIEKKSNWIEVQNEKLNDEELIILRIKLKSNDKIYNMFLTEE